MPRDLNLAQNQPASLTSNAQSPHPIRLLVRRGEGAKADGSWSPCNCAPEVLIPAESPAETWDGPALQAWRQGMTAAANGACQGCPRY